LVERLYSFEGRIVAKMGLGVISSGIVQIVVLGVKDGGIISLAV
jgi:hypothetical protein